jgi:hypothetical protein
MGIPQKKDIMSFEDRQLVDTLQEVLELLGALSFFGNCV